MSLRSETPANPLGASWMARARQAAGGMARLSALTLAGALAACASDDPPRDFAPLQYGYLTKLRLNVGDVQIKPDFLPKAEDLGPQSPAPPARTLEEALRERVVPGGSSGRAEVKIMDASILPSGGMLNGSMAVHVDVYTGSGTRSGFAEARVSRSLTNPDRGPNALRGALYEVTTKMMGDMNVELEYQIRHSLKDWLQDTASTAVPGAVQQQSLAAPPGAKAGAPVSVSAPSAAAPSMTAPSAAPPAAVPPVLAPPAVSSSPSLLGAGQAAGKVRGGTLSPPPGYLTVPK